MKFSLVCEREEDGRWLSSESLYRALSAEGNPSFATVLKVAKALGMKLYATAA